MKTEVLLIENNRQLQQEIKEGLEKIWDVNVTILDCTIRIRHIISTNRYDAVIIGYRSDLKSVIEGVRLSDVYIPIAIYAHFYPGDSLVEYLEAGVDITMIHPLSYIELVCRLRRQITKAPVKTLTDIQEPIKFVLGPIVFDFTNLKVTNTVTGEESVITAKEANLFRYFCENVNSDISRVKALSMIWGATDHYTSRTMDVYVSRIRKRIKDTDDVRLIVKKGKTIRLEVNEIKTA